MKEIDFSVAIQTCCLYPFSPENVNYSKITLKETKKPVSIKSKSKLTHLQYLESKIENTVLKDFKNSKFSEDNNCLYNLWLQFKNEDAQLREFYICDEKGPKKESTNEIIMEVNTNIHKPLIGAQDSIQFEFPEFNDYESWPKINSATENLIDRELSLQKKMKMKPTGHL